MIRLFNWIFNILGMIGTAAFPQTKNPLKLKWAEVVFASLVFFVWISKGSDVRSKGPSFTKRFYQVRTFVEKVKTASF